MSSIHRLNIHYTNSIQEAQRFLQQGFEPIECAFGEGSVIGALCMDHHGPESWREGVALRACRDHFGARQDDPRFVVTGTPDADAILAIIALAALVPSHKIDPAFYQLVNRRDLDPIGINLLDEPFGDELLRFQQTERLRRDQPSFYRAVRTMIQILLEGLTYSQRIQTRRREEKRLELAEQSKLTHFPPHIAVVESNVWGFDLWYQRAPLIISYSQRHQSITIGCRDMEHAHKLFGEQGLMVVFPTLGEGWGGRETIGGSPRNACFPPSYAYEVAKQIAQFLE